LFLPFAYLHQPADKQVHVIDIEHRGYRRQRGPVEPGHEIPRGDAHRGVSVLLLALRDAGRSQFSALQSQP
jgi:hypothetical protein